MAGGTVKAENTAGDTAVGRASGPAAARRDAAARGDAAAREDAAARGERDPGAVLPRGLAWGAGPVLAALLFAGYLRVSWTAAATADGAAQALQARDMLAGNWLLHGWTLSDVSFYTTELPEYVLVELIRPLGTGVIHVAAAVSYTLLVGLAYALARGPGRGRTGVAGVAGVAGGILTAGIMLAPQLGYGAFVLLLSPDHTGTQVPLLLGWLLLDRAPRRWWVPAGLCLVLAWVQFADRAALLTGVLPLFLVAAVTLIRTASRLIRAARRGQAVSRGRAGWWTACWFEGALAVAAVASAGTAWAGARLLAAAGGFTAHPLPFTLAPLRLLWTHTWLTGWGILELYGANFLGVTGWAGLTFAALHLAGLALAAAATVVALRRFLWSRRPALADTRLAGARQAGARQADTGRVDSVLAVGIVANLVSYVLSIEPGTVLGTGYDAREIAAVLPLGAVLAGRVFGPKLAQLTGLTQPTRLSQLTRLGHFPSLRTARDDFPSVTTRLPPHLGGYAPQEVMGSGDGAREVMGSGDGARGVSGRRESGLGAVAGRVRSAGAVSLVLACALGMAGYASALAYSAAQPAAAGPDVVLADWLAGHGLRYGLGGASANIVTLDSGGRTEVAGVTVTKGRVGALLYQSSAAAYDPRLHDATFMVTGTPAARAGDAAEAVSAAAVRATFGVPERVYRFRGFTVDVWDVNLLTKLRGAPVS